MAAVSDRSRLVFGTYEEPRPHVLDRFYAGGGRALDVANVYRDGESARAAGRWLRRAPEDVVVYAKGCHPPRCSPELVAAEIDEARRLLGLDRIDVFLLHRDDPTRPVAEWADALLEPLHAGTIGGFGVSNWTLERVRELHDHLNGLGLRPGLTLSNHFSLAEMVSPPWPGCLALAPADLHALAALDVTVIAWSSLATGYFAGRDVVSWDSPSNRERRERAAALAGTLGTTAAAIALAFVLHQPPNVLAAVGTRSEAHLEEAFAAVDLELTPDQLAWLARGERVTA
jgi:aryl-alcohol dehydrogenase-like predicted oxidoreductase